MKKIVTVIPLLAVLVAASVIPAAASPGPLRTQADPPTAACVDLVTKLSDTVKKAVAPLAAVPPDPGKVATPLGDSLGVLTQMQSSKCLPTPPVSVPPAPVALPSTDFLGPEQCLSATMTLFGTIFGVLGKVVPGAGVPDLTKLLAEVASLLKALSDALAACGLPAPPGGLPTLPAVPSLPGGGLPAPSLPAPGLPAPSLPGLPAAA